MTNLIKRLRLLGMELNNPLILDAADEIRSLRASASPSDAQEAARYRWLSRRVVITDGSTSGLMVITAVDDGSEYGNKFLDEFTEPAIAASAPKGDGND